MSTGIVTLMLVRKWMLAPGFASALRSPLLHFDVRLQILPVRQVRADR